MAVDTKALTGDSRKIVLRLFIAGDAPNSRLAKENLRRFCERAAGIHFELEIIDVLDNPQVMQDCGIYLTPAFQIIEPGPGRLIYGNLSNEEALQTLLY